MTTIKRKRKTRNVFEKSSCIATLLGFFLLLAFVGLWTVTSSSETKTEKYTPLKLNKNKRVEHFDVNEDPIELIKKGHLHLINISLNSLGGARSPYSVSGKFCRLNWSAHKTDPASVPMFKDLQGRSPGCHGSTVSVDLHTAVREARTYDSEHNLENIKSMSPTGFVFHESRCGSTLVANSLASFEPTQNRVYSESPPPIAAFKSFDSNHEKESIQLIQDVIYMMGRTNDLNEENLFFKVQSIGSKSIGVMRKAFPSTPWIYVYRDPVQVMKSHLKVKGTTKAVCLRSQFRPPSDLSSLAKDVSGLSPEDLSNEQFCAAHLATLCGAAEREIEDSSGLGRLVNYVDLPSILIEDIIPHHFLKQSGPLSPEAKQRIMEVNMKYSKGRKSNRLWKEDSEEKEESAWQEMKDAAAEFLQPVYDRMEAMRKDPGP